MSFVSFATILLNTKDLSLRQAEKLFAHTRLVLSSFQAKNFIFPRLLLLMMFIKIFHPDIFNTIKEKRLKTQKLIEKIESLFPDNISDDESLRSFVFTIVELAVSYNNFFNEKVYGSTKLFIEETSSGEKTIDLESKFDKTDNKDDLIVAYESLMYRGHRSLKISFLLEKIDLLEPVNFQ